MTNTSMISDPPGNGFETKVFVRHHHWNWTKKAWARFNDDGTVDVIAIRNNGDYGGLFHTVDPKLVEVI